MSTEIIKVPDIGSDSDVEVIEICVAVGDQVNAEDSLIVLESDKASMDVPSPVAGVVKAIKLKVGDQVNQGHDILELEIEGAAEAPAAAPAPAAEPAPAPVAETTPAPAPVTAASAIETIDVPDIGDSGEVEVIEISVSVGDEIAEEDSVLVLESDKASMEVPSPVAGKVLEVLVNTGDKVAQGHPILRVETAGGAVVSAPAEAPAPAPVAEAAPAPVAAPAPAAGPVRKEIFVPDLSGNNDVPVIEVSVAVGDEVDAEDGLLVLETDKATMEIPAPHKGKLVEFNISEGQTVNQGDLIGVMEVMEAAPAQPVTPAAAPTAPAPAGAQPAASASVATPAPAAPSAQSGRKTGKVHAGPAVRMTAREFGIDLLDVTPTGPRGRILKEDVQAYVKQVMQQVKSAPQKAATPAATGGAGIPPIPAVDFSQFGEIEEKPMGRLLKVGAMNLHRSWLNVPHVTQFDEADITELEKFRKSMKAEAEKRGTRLTPLPFILKACAYAMQKYPQFNVSLHPDGDKLIQKKYIHIGFAVDTPDGLLVPVVRDVDQKSLWELADATADLASRAQKKKLTADDMKGGCFTISSLGSIGGTAFTPIVNAPEVAILGVSKASMKPVWNGSDFVPRQMLPLSLSYDHRAINGADAARFTAFIAAVLADIRQMLM